MFHVFIKITLFIVLAVSLHADRGLSQTHLLSISTGKNVEISFDLPIVQSSLKKDTLELKKVDSHKGVQGKSTLKDENTLLFTPSEELLEGSYELHVKPMKLQTCVQEYDNWFKKFFFRDKCSITTKPIHHRFTIDVNQPKIVSLDFNQTALSIKEAEKTTVKIYALYDDNSTTDVTQDVEWIVGDNTIIAVVKEKLSALREGTTTLQALYSGIKSQEIKITVYKEINGYILPLEPDKALNNSTLLGIDANNNGVRDDVERWIFLEMEIYNGYEKIEQAIAMQTAKAFQMTLKDPTNKDDKVEIAMNAAHDCWNWYDYSKQSHVFGSHGKFGRALKDKSFNTKDRLKTYWEYDNTLRGRIFTSTPTLQTQTQCEISIDGL
ncbi:MAG TPA: hypothetical protein VLZ29_07315 [Sulfurimonas sp.]|uniref:hypothetical protein n=1 Tax=Sulfurimonas sp. TaxID=2022749 RepID=UPI002B8D9FED|nr:hypothetical protein [Sulfurimonas sp.]HUH42907.1 hypothetical protein [Sulfurimonas sp.]